MPLFFTLIYDAKVTCANDDANDDADADADDDNRAEITVHDINT